MNNPNNYPGINADIVGNAYNDPESPRYDKDGTRGIKEVRIAVNRGYRDKDNEWISKPTMSVRYTAKAEELEGIGKGDTIRIDGARLEEEPYTRADGTSALGLEARFGTVTIVKKAGSTEGPF